MGWTWDSWIFFLERPRARNAAPKEHEPPRAGSVARIPLANTSTGHWGAEGRAGFTQLFLIASLLVLPMLPRDSLKPPGPEHPALHISWVLVLTVGFPFFLLSATSPLLQAWLASTRKDSGAGANLGFVWR